MSVDMATGVDVEELAADFSAIEIVQKALHEINGHIGADRMLRSCLNTLVTRFQVQMRRKHDYEEAIKHATDGVKHHHGCDSVVPIFEKAMHNAVIELCTPFVVVDGRVVVINRLSNCMQVALSEYALELTMLAGADDVNIRDYIDDAVMQAGKHSPVCRLTEETRTEAAILLRAFVEQGGDVNRLLKEPVAA